MLIKNKGVSSCFSVVFNIYASQIIICMRNKRDGERIIMFLEFEIAGFEIEADRFKSRSDL